MAVSDQTIDALAALQLLVIQALRNADDLILVDVAIGLDSARLHLASHMRDVGAGDRVIDVPHELAGMLFDEPYDSP